jgi:hypothetical protein
MKLYILSIIALSLVMIGCSPQVSNEELAAKYKLELQYYNNAVKFAELNMNSQAIESCEMTHTLRSECFTSLTQMYMSKNITMNKSWCDEIHPQEKMNMTMKAFQMVYPEIDDPLKKELKEKISPTKQKKAALFEIRSECERRSQ